MKHYDYIISGSGAAGLSLLMRLMQHRFFDNKKILVVDKVPKDKNDRTWCFWETEPGLFEPVVYHQWQQAHFYSNQFSSLLNLSPYSYKMIRGIDFYKCVIDEAAHHTNIEFKFGEVQAVGNDGIDGLVIIGGERYTAGFVFNSILFQQPYNAPSEINLLQHFKGYLIETQQPAFNAEEATLMDFRVSQHEGTTFAYVLPFSSTRALVEYTLFTPTLLQKDLYDQALHSYISSYLNIQNYTIEESEFGVIPMTSRKFTKQNGKVINIGTAGGQTKASSGYTFQFIQKQTALIVDDLMKYGYPKNHESFFEKRFKFYDNTLLYILYNKKLSGEKIFTDLFQKNPPPRVLRFLDNESTLEDEINLMATLPQMVFIKAAMQQILKQNR